MRVLRPDPAAAVPLVYDSPHSGRDYPDDFAPLVPVEQLHGYEDRLVDALIADAPEWGIVLVAAGFPRAYVDPNRAADDLDRLVAGEDWADAIAPTVYSERGLGLVFRVTAAGEPLYERPLAARDLRRRIALYWQAYHDALDEALSAAQARWGAVWHIDWHSMRPVGDALAPDPAAVRADFVVGDLDGTSAEPAFTDFAVAALRERGFSVAVNAPFKGGHITRLHGRPAEGRHSIQIEINRGLYLDAGLLEHGPGWEKLRRDLSGFSREAAAFAADRAAAIGS